MLIAHLILFQFYGTKRVSGSMSTIVLLLFSFLPSFVFGEQYNIINTVIGKNFYDFFIWQTLPDPTHGRVQYVDQKTARELNLTFASQNTFILRAENKEYLNPSGPGRKSVRIHSKHQFTKHVAIFNVRHMPEGCGTWPAIWEVANSGWPAGGEIDIVEGANDQSPNVATLHTLPGCKMPKSRPHSGNPMSNNCQSSGSNNQGCSVKFTSKNSFGPEFNKQGGGWYAVERSDSYVKIFFWSRGSKKVPNEVKTGASSVNPNNWGNPAAYFPNTFCDFGKFFSKHRIVINLTFCGDWAGRTFAQAGCHSSCFDFVNNNPKSFRGAYFDIASIRIYK